MFSIDDKVERKLEGVGSDLMTSVWKERSRREYCGSLFGITSRDGGEEREKLREGLYRNQEAVEGGIFHFAAFDGEPPKDVEIPKSGVIGPAKFPGVRLSNARRSGISILLSNLPEWSDSRRSDRRRECVMDP